MLSLWITLPAVVVVLAGYPVARGSHPTDAELIARFWLHEADFQALARMLDSDRRKLPPEAGPFDLAHLATAAPDTARVGNYEALLGRIGARDFSYFPRSGNVLVPVSEPGKSLTGSTKSYLYSSHDDPQPLRWRGPGVYFVTGDYRIKGQWFIHHDGTVVVAFAPY